MPLNFPDTFMKTWAGARRNLLEILNDLGDSASSSQFACDFFQSRIININAILQCEELAFK
jgi:hypothetical protein